MAEAREVLRLSGLRKSYNIGRPNEVEVLHGIDLRLDSADFAALVGPSGSGKSTLLNQIGLLDSPTAGELYLLGQPTRDMDDAARTALLLADEPAGNLDTQTAADVFALLRRFNRQFGCAVLVVTHDPRLAESCGRAITLIDGRIRTDVRRADVPPTD